MLNGFQKKNHIADSLSKSFDCDDWETTDASTSTCLIYGVPTTLIGLPIILIRKFSYLIPNIGAPPPLKSMHSKIYGKMKITTFRLLPTLFQQYKTSTILDTIFVDFFTFKQSFFSSQVKRNLIIVTKKRMYKLPHKLPNDSKLKIIRKEKISKKSLKYLDLMASNQPTTQKPNFDI